jgi:site-specific recombinase XerC
MRQRKRKTKIYCTDNLFVYDTENGTFAIEGIIDGKRIRQRAKTLDEAKLKCHVFEEAKQDVNVARTTLDQKQLRDAERVFDILPDGISLDHAVETFLCSYNVIHTDIEDAVWDFIKTKENSAKKTYEQTKSILMRFARWAEGKSLESITSDDAADFLKTVPVGSYNHFLRYGKSLYLWAIRNRLVSGNPFALIRPLVRQHTEVGVLSCDEVEALLCASRSFHGGELTAYAAITLFAGLRPDSEMRHLTWEAINLEDAEIRVTMGKTRIPRTVRISDNLVEWLKICDRSQPIYPVSFRGKWGTIRNAAGFKGGASNSKAKKAAEADLKPWVKDYTRHSAISYRVRQKGDIHKTATWAGNSPRIINSHYLGLVTGSEAKRYWNIGPEHLDTAILKTSKRFLP